VSDFAPTTDRKSTKLDSAETFAESDVTVSTTDAAVASESVGIRENYGYDLTAGGNLQTNINEAGAIIVPSVPLKTITGKSFSQNQTFDSARLVDDSDGSVLDESTNNVSGGESVTLDASGAVVGDRYRFILYDSNGQDVDYTDTSPGNLPTGPEVAFDIVDGWGDQTRTRPWGWDTIDVEAGIPSGTAYVEWPTPNDVYAWDTATFQRTVDSETVDVYVEEAQGSPGWTEVAGPISRGDAIPADPANNVRYRIEFSRSDISNNPTLDAIYRRIKL
jgi:hypothetical protein